MCYVTIFDGSGKPITVEVSREIYQVFADYPIFPANCSGGRCGIGRP